MKAEIRICSYEPRHAIGALILAISSTLTGAEVLPLEIGGQFKRMTSSGTAVKVINISDVAGLHFDATVMIFGNQLSTEIELPDRLLEECRDWLRYYLRQPIRLCPRLDYAANPILLN